MTPDSASLRSIHSFKQLVAYLRSELDWPIESDDFEELTFDYAAEELGLDKATAVKIKEIKQLRPLSSKQPWGIFFVNFEPKHLPVVALRRILSTLVLKKRQSANRAQQAAWRLHDLLFISSYGEAEHRDLTFAHFAEEKEMGDLPTLRVLGWDDEDTPLHIGHVAHELKTKLRWPKDEADVETWRARWSSAFTLRHREVIRTSQQLAVQLADLARSIRRRANSVLRVESERGALRKLYAAFKEALIHDLTEDDFADMYAQTISYGLLTARVSRPAALVADNLSDMVPVTNPFLRELLETFLTVGGRKNKIDFDELGINDVVQLLRDADMEAVLRDFDDRNPQEDPAILFYELFLKEYDPKKRVERGVFYTPRPVVSFIARSVHEILKKEFLLEDGLADTTTWGEMAKRHTGLKIPTGVTPSEPFVQVLDPATGTGTFLVEIIDVIHRTMEERWRKQGHMALEFQALWNDYVPKHLLPRLFGFELMMAPYAIAHMKIGLKLAATGYRFGTAERARIYMTNSLEPPTEHKEQREFDELAPALARESRAVSAVKAHQRFTVVVGNPPYSGISANMSRDAQQLVDPYRVVDGEPLNERKVWLQDDYVKFIRIGQMTIDQASVGVLGYITNHGYLDNPTFRGMRQSILSSFSCVRVLDLHGNANKKEQAPDGSEDQNVFDIRQGVAISIGSKMAGNARANKPLLHSELWGSREAKYKWLTKSTTIAAAFQEVAATSPYYFFVQQLTSSDACYDTAMPINDVFVLGNSGVVTARDGLVLDLDLNDLKQRMKEFCDPRISDGEIKARFDLSENYAWRISVAREELMAERNHDRFFTRMLYRPFNERHVFFHRAVVWRTRQDVMSQLGHKANLALITTRQTRDAFGALTTRLIVGHKSVAAYDINSVFPLYVHDEEDNNRELLPAERRHANLSKRFVAALCARFGVERGKDGVLPLEIAPEDVFHYIYAVLYSPAYRDRYSELLRIEYPRVPLAGAIGLFRALARLGSDLVALHLLESPRLDESLSEYSGGRNPEVEKPSYADKVVWLDQKRTSGFRGVPESVWNFYIGGYRVCEKWLKDRKGRKLSKDDIEHFQKIVVALSETIRIMADIDKVIDAHGGWPGAFQSAGGEKASAAKAKVH